MRRLLLVVAALAAALNAASITGVRAVPTPDGVAVSAGLEGRFSSVLLGSLGQITEAVTGGTWQIRYRVELRREIPCWPDQVVTDDVFTYRIHFPGPTASELQVELVSERAGYLGSASGNGEWAKSVVGSLGRLGRNGNVWLTHQWSPEDAGRSFHVRVRGEMDVPYEVDDKTEWMDSGSFVSPVQSDGK